MKSFLVMVVVALLFVIALVFGAKNEQIVTISYFIAQGEFRLPIVLGVVFLAGFILCWLFSMFYIVRTKLKLRTALKQLAQLKPAEGSDA
ncbi:LapA family protein [Shewanella marina]|uniref:LapA family protein n=1 Tax=Shewanella marina TaxID=487319 RepID=UPI0004724C22|nr:lipopolysaccharide assembly protein LapA domain-containing protein [Shewanella marina]